LVKKDNSPQRQKIIRLPGYQVVGIRKSGYQAFWFFESLLSFAFGVLVALWQKSEISNGVNNDRGQRNSA
jgi:predicted outer membrane lipoprotein